MDHKRMTYDFRAAEARAVDLNAIRDFQQELERLHQQIEFLATRHDVCTEDLAELDGARVLVARAGLTLQQKVMPVLDELQNCALNYAGAAAVRTACADIIRTERDETPIDSIKSGFELPAEYRETIVDEVKSALTR
jgi:hypothetical protein